MLSTLRLIRLHGVWLLLSTCDELPTWKLLTARGQLRLACKRNLLLSPSRKLLLATLLELLRTVGLLLAAGRRLLVTRRRRRLFSAVPT